MATVNDYGFELSDVPFGIGQDVTVENEGFDPGAAEWIVQDTEDSRDGHTRFGRDKLGGPTWTWVLSTDKETPEEALAAAGRLAAAWRAEEIRDDPGATLRLRYRVGGRTRCVFGRPRRWAAPPSNRILTGYIPITADFKCVDHLHYDDAQDEVLISVSPTSAGGFVLPQAPPLTSLPSGDREGMINVGGDQLTAPIIRIDGPIVNPWVQGLDWRIDLDLSLTAGQWVEVDARPWRATVLRNGATNASEALGRRQWLHQVRLTPGNQEIRFGGSGSAGTSTCRVTWRNAWSYL